jgi:glycosyltransferase involved in cell wall biosynthesis
MSRVLLLPSAFHPSLGGVEEIARNLAIELVKQHHDVTVAVNRHPQDLPEEETLFGIAVHRFNFYYPRKSADQLSRLPIMLQCLSRFNSFLRSWKPDIVHLICPSSAAYYVYLLRKFVNFKILVTFQGELFMDANKIYEKSFLMKFGLRKLLSIADGVTACSSYVLADARQKYKINHAIQEVIFNGVDLDESCDGTAINVSPQQQYIFSLGRLVHNKGFDVLIKAFELIASSHPDISLIIAGDGVEKENLENIIKSGGLTDRIKLVGRKNRAEVGTYFRDCAFFVLPSPVEPFGIVCLEAMRAGKAIIATDSGGPPEFIAHDSNGLLVTPNDAKALSEAIGNLLDNPELNSKMGDSCLRKVEQFSWREITKEYILIYEKLCI